MQTRKEESGKRINSEVECRTSEFFNVKAPNIFNVEAHRATYVKGTVNFKLVDLLVDSGAAVSLLCYEFWLNCKINSDEICPCNIKLTNASGQTIPTLGLVSCKVNIGGVNTCHDFILAKSLAQPVILGTDFLKINKWDLQFSCGHLKNGRVRVPLLPSSVVNKKIPHESCPLSVIVNTVVPENSEKIIFCKLRDDHFESGCIGMIEASVNNKHELLIGKVVTRVNNGVVPVRVMNLCSVPVTLYKGTRIANFEPHCEVLEIDAEQQQHNSSGSDLFDLSQCKLSDSDKVRLSKLLDEFSDIISKDSNDLGSTDLVYHKINTGDAVPIKQAPRRVPIHLRETVNKEISKMEKQGIIKHSISPWASPIVLVKKPDGSIRFCVDYRKLNDVTKKDAYPLPKIDDILDSFNGAEYYSTLDMTSGYWQVQVDPSDREKTAFCTGQSFFEFQVMPFGLCNAPSTYQRLMDRILSGLQWETCMVYLDDVVIYSKTVEEHFSRLREIFNRFRNAKLKLKPGKCHLFQKKVKFLGFELSKDGVSAQSSKSEAILNWPTPTNVEQLRAFIGTASYYRRFIKNFAEIASPLHKLTSVNVKEFRFTQECQKSFETLKKKLTTTPILSYPRLGSEFILDTDASSTGLGAVLSQIQDGVERVIGYASRTLTKPETKYCVTRREMLAVVFGTKKFRHYLYGQEFTVRTDHSSLRWLQSFKDPENQVARWLEQLAEFKFKVQHRPGKSHGNADGLSRSCRQCGQEFNSRTSVTVSAVEVEEERCREIEQKQIEDDCISKIIQWKKEEKRPSYHDVCGSSPILISLWAQWTRLTLKNGILYRSWINEDESVTWQLVVPKNLIPQVLKQLHDSPTAGHLGVDKTLAKVRSRFYWPKMNEDVILWCKSCVPCNQKKNPTPHRKAPMSLRKPGFPFERVAIDILGPLPRTENSKRYILCITDYFSKWAEAFPLENIEAETVACVVVEQFISRFGAPNEIHTDQGRQFESQLFQNLCQLMEIKKTRTTPYHPQSDGLVERYNRTLCTMLSHYCNDKQNNWDKYLQSVMMAYRASPQKSTGYSPYYVLFGRNIRLPIDLLFRAPQEDSTSNIHEYIQQLKTTSQKIGEKVRENLGVAQKLQKDFYDRGHTVDFLQEGDTVMVHIPAGKKGLSPKLSKYWDGPYKVVKKFSDVTYKVKKINGVKIRIVHFNRMKRVIVRDEDLAGVVDEDDGVEENETSNTDDQKSPVDDPWEDYFSRSYQQH